MQVRGRIFLLFVFVLLAAIVGCSSTAKPVVDTSAPAGDGVPAQVVAAQGTRFVTGSLPFGWRRLLRGDAKAGFMNEVHGQAIMINVVYAPNRKAGLVALRNHLLFDLTHRRILEHETTEVDHREALWTVAEGRFDGALVKMALVVVRIDDWVYDIVYISAPDNYEMCLVDFKSFLTGFHQQRNYKSAE